MYYKILIYFRQKLTEDTQERRLLNKGSISKLQFHNRDEDLILTLGKKEFSHHEHQNVFMDNGGKWVSYMSHLCIYIM